MTQISYIYTWELLVANLQQLVLYFHVFYNTTSVLIPTLMMRYQYDFNGRPNRRVCWVGILKDWRKEWRSELKRKYKKYSINQQALEHVLNQLVREQWENLITHWSSDKTKVTIAGSLVYYLNPWKFIVVIQ